MRRALVLVVPIAFALVACSGDDDDQGVTVPDVSIPDVTVPDVTSPAVTVPDVSVPDLSLPDNISVPDISIPDNAAELIGQMFPQLDDEQIDCLVDAAGEVGGEVTDQSQLLDYLSECNVDASDLLGGG